MWTYRGEESLKKQLLSTIAVAAIAVAAGSAQAGTLFIGRLTSAQEVPPNASTATGTGTLILNDARTSALVSVTHNVPAATVTAGHIHRAAAGVNGPVIFPFPNPNAVTNLTWAIPAADVTNLENNGLYFNIHSQSRPGGEIRGQISRARLAPAANNSAQAAVAAAMDVSFGFAADLDTALINLNLAAVSTQTAGLEDLSGRTVYVASRQGLEAMQSFAGNLLARSEETRLAGGAPDGSIIGFVTAGYDFGDRDGGVGEAASKISRPFAMGGFEFNSGDGMSAGLAIGQANGEDKIKNNGGKVEVDVTTVSGFFSTKASDSVALDLVVGYGWGDIDSSRNLATFNAVAEGESDSNNWGITAKVSSMMDMGGNATLLPYLMLDYRDSKVGNYTETGAGSLGLIVPDHKRKNSNAEIGGTAAIPLDGDNLTARLQLAWQQRLSGKADTISTRLVGSAVAFDTTFLGLPKSAAKMGASLNAKLGDGVVGALGYRGLLGGSRIDLHAIEARLSMTF